MESVINLLDTFFERDFNERKKDLNKINNLNKEKDIIKEKVTKISEFNEDEIKRIKDEYKNKISSSLKSKKNELVEQLKSKNYSIILDEINSQMILNLKGLEENIENFLNINEKNYFEFSKKAKEIINNFSLNYKFEINFKSYISKRLGNDKKNLEKQIFEELKNSCESCGNIFLKKGISEWFNSLFSDLSYLENIIDILIDTSLKKINFIFDLIKEETYDCYTKISYFIEFLVNSASLEFNGEQKKIWKKLCD